MALKASMASKTAVRTGLMTRSANTFPPAPAPRQRVLVAPVRAMAASRAGSVRSCAAAASMAVRLQGDRIGVPTHSHTSRLVGPSSGRRAIGSYRARRSPAVRVEANLFSRIYRLVKTTVDNLVSSFEDPERLLDRIVVEMSEDAIKLRQATAQVIGSLRQLEARQRNMQSQSDQWLQRAELAVRSGQDELAKEALRRRKGIQQEADRLSQQVEAQAKASDQLQANVRVLEGRIAEAKAKKETLKARATSAKTSKQIQELVGGLRSTSSSSFAAFEKMEEKVLAMEAEAETAAMLVAPDNLEQKFVQLEGGMGVDAELAALKRVAAGDSASQRPRIADVIPRYPAVPVPASPDIEAELQALREKARM